jgi:hypothetical protein
MHGNSPRDTAPLAPSTPRPEGTGPSVTRARLLHLLGPWIVCSALASVGGFTMSRAGIAETDAASEFFAVALPILKRTTEVRGFAFDDVVYAGSAELTLTKLGPLPPAKSLDQKRREYLLAKLGDRSSYLFGVRKATRFYADYGLIFVGSETPNALLLSTEFKGARLVLATPFDPRVAIVNLDPIFAELSAQVIQELQ